MKNLEQEMSSVSVSEPVENGGDENPPGENVTEAAAGAKDTKLFIGEIGPESTGDSLKAYFSKFGTVGRIVLKRSPNDSRRPFAFVTIDGDIDQVCAWVL